jgi:hypothetical protein
MARRPIANGCVVGSKSTIGLIRGETLWVGASSIGDGGGRARVRQQSSWRRPRWNTVVLTGITPSDPITRSCFSICLFISHPIITKFYTHNLVVSINIFRTFFE